MKMIIGLGNPGKRYEKNRHNVGFHCVDAFAEKHGFRFDGKQAKAKVVVGTVSLPAGAPEISVPAAGDGTVQPAAMQPVLLPQRLALAKPQTFMNESGKSVVGLTHFYRVALADVLVVFDDLDLPLGVVRLRASGGSGGHNGMRSIISAVGSSDFPRLRVGIGRPPGRMDPAAYVLQDFTAEQAEVMVQVRDLAVAACEHWLAFGIVSAMNAFNAKGVGENSTD